MSFSQWPLSDTTASFLEELDRKITDRSGEPSEAQFLFQRDRAGTTFQLHFIPRNFLT